MTDQTPAPYTDTLTQLGFVFDPAEGSYVHAQLGESVGLQEMDALSADPSALRALVEDIQRKLAAPPTTEGVTHEHEAAAPTAEPAGAPESAAPAPVTEESAPAAAEAPAAAPAPDPSDAPAPPSSTLAEALEKQGLVKAPDPAPAAAPVDTADHSDPGDEAVDTPPPAAPPAAPAQPEDFQETTEPPREVTDAVEGAPEPEAIVPPQAALDAAAAHGVTSDQDENSYKARCAALTEAGFQQKGQLWVHGETGRSVNDALVKQWTAGGLDAWGRWITALRGK